MTSGASGGGTIGSISSRSGPCRAASTSSARPAVQSPLLSLTYTTATSRSRAWATRSAITGTTRRADRMSGSESEWSYGLSMSTTSSAVLIVPRLPDARHRQPARHAQRRGATRHGQPARHAQRRGAARHGQPVPGAVSRGPWAVTARPRSHLVLGGTLAAELEPQPRTRPVGSERAARGRERAVEQDAFDPDVVCEVLDVERGFRRAVRGERERPRLAQAVDAEEVRDSAAAGDVGLEDVDGARAEQLLEHRQVPPVLAGGNRKPRRGAPRHLGHSRDVL